jgi:hypothetical protein
MGALLDLALEAYQPARESRTTDSSPERRRRIALATKMLRLGPSQRCAFIAGDMTDGAIPVTVVIRSMDGLIAGELLIPSDRWDPLLFMKFLRDQDAGELT